jgi:hypothetical protein
MTLSDFDQAMRHKYRVESGGPFVPGVTSVINIADKAGLKWASSKIAAETAVINSRKKRTIVPAHRAKLAASKGKTESAIKNRTLAENGTDDEIYIHFCRGEFDRQWRAKATRGNRVHDVAERWSRGEAVEVLDEDSKYVDALETFHKLYKPKFHYVECVVLNRERKYGGRFDGITELDGPGAEGLYWIDYKSGGEYVDSVAQQFAGYMDCEFPIYDDHGKLTGLMSIPESDGARTVYLGGDGTVSVKDPFAIVPRHVAWRAFEASLDLFNAVQEMNNYIGKEES